MHAMGNLSAYKVFPFTEKNLTYTSKALNLAQYQIKKKPVPL